MKDEVTLLKNELQTNYTNCFKSAFQDKLFEKKWKQFFEIIKNTGNKIQDFSFSIEDKKAFKNATIEAATLQNEEKVNDEDSHINLYRIP